MLLLSSECTQPFTAALSDTRGLEKGVEANVLNINFQNVKLLQVLSDNSQPPHLVSLMQLERLKWGAVCVCLH